MTITRFAPPTTIHFGAGARRLVAGHLLDQGVRRPLVVTDRALARLPVMAEFLGHLDGLQVAVYDGVHGNPTCAQVMAGAAAFKAHEADAVIGFGAGAVNPYMAFESISDMIDRDVITGIDREKALSNYIKAAGKGVLKVMSKMGTSWRGLYCHQTSSRS